MFRQLFKNIYTFYDGKVKSYVSNYKKQSKDQFSDNNIFWHKVICRMKSPFLKYNLLSTYALIYLCLPFFII